MKQPAQCRWKYEKNTLWMVSIFSFFLFYYELIALLLNFFWCHVDFLRLWLTAVNHIKILLLIFDGKEAKSKSKLFKYLITFDYPKDNFLCDRSAFIYIRIYDNSRSKNRHSLTDSLLQKVTMKKSGSPHNWFDWIHWMRVRQSLKLLLVGTFYCKYTSSTKAIV